jgi:glutathione S-transferase
MSTSGIPKLVLCDFDCEPPSDPRWSAYSPFVLKVARVLTLAKLPFQTERVAYTRIKRLNPTGQLPVLMIDGEAVADSTLILQRIEQLVPGVLSGGLEGSRLAEAWLWEEFADTALYPHVLVTRWKDARGWPVVHKAFFGALPPVVRDFVAGMVRRKTLDRLIARDFTRADDASYDARLTRVLDQLEARAPEVGFWMGVRLSIADVALFAQLHSLRLPATDFRAREIAARRRLSIWLDRVDAATSGNANKTAPSAASSVHPPV